MNSGQCKKMLVLLVIGIATALGTTLLLSPSADAVGNYRYISHRGLVNKTYPGNTKEAFKQAAGTAGIWGIETDIYRTKDGHFVCLHGSGGTATWQKMAVASTKLSKLRAKKDGKYALPTLEEFLSACKSGGKVAVIEFKDKQFNSNKAYAEAVVKLVKKAGMLNQCEFISFQHKGVNWAQNYAKGTYKVSVPSYALATNSQSAVNTAVDAATNYGLTGVSVHTDQVAYAKKRVAAKASGKKIQAWTYSNEAAARGGINAGLHAATGEFKPAQYAVTFKDSVDGKTLRTQWILYSDSASAPAAPSHAGYTFTGWSRSVANITATTTITANYSRNKYTVVFKDGIDGKSLKNQTVEYGKAASSPAAPTHIGYTFSKWDKAYSKITGNLMVTALYSPNKYKVVFKDGVNSKALKEQTVEYAKAATASANPSRTGYTFAGWDKAFNNVTGNLTVTAKWNINSYAVIFKDGLSNVVLKNQTVQYGKAATAPAAPTHEGYKFVKWDRAFDDIGANTTVTAVYAATAQAPSVTKYSVVFKDGVDGRVLKEQEVEYGKSATAPAVPTHAGYAFSKWDKSFSSVTGNITVIAIYRSTSAILYTVTFKDGMSGMLISSQTVESGKSASAPSAPAHTGYAFAGWDKGFSSVTSDITVTATYKRVSNESSQLKSIRNATVVDKSGNVIVSGRSTYKYEQGNPVCPVSEIHVGGKKVSKGEFLTYYFKNRKAGTATVVLRGVHDAGYKDALILKFKIA